MKAFFLPGRTENTPGMRSLLDWVGEPFPIPSLLFAVSQSRLIMTTAELVVLFGACVQLSN